MKRCAGVLLAVLTAAVLSLGLLVGAAGPASAHATLVSTDPAEGSVLTETPDVVTFTFDEAVSLPGQAVQVFDATGEPVDSESTSRDDVITTDLPDTLADGSYVVVWRAISADGHPIAGSLTFAIGAPSPQVAAPQVPDADPADVRNVLSVFQALSYVGLLLAAGLVLFWAWSVRDVRLDAAVRRRVLTVAWSATGLALVSGVAIIPLTGAYQQGLGLDQLGESAAVDPSLVGDDLVVLALQALGLVAGLVLLARTTTTSTTPTRRGLTVAAVAVAALSPALVGHSRAIDPVWLMVVTDVLHLAAGATWFGGLVGLVLVLRSLAGRERDAALVLARFSAVAAGLLGLLAVTGSLMGWRILGGWAPLLDTTYGRLLLVKVAVAAVVAAVAGFNRWRLLPAATGAQVSGHEARRSAVLRVRGAVRVEGVLLVVLLAVTGFLTNQSPREGPVNRAPVASQVAVGVLQEDTGLKVLATATPRTTGPNTITVQLQDQAGEPMTAFAEPSVTVSSADGAVELGEQPVVPSDAGTYLVETVIPAPGTWVVQVGVRLTEFDNPVTTVEIEVS